MTFQRVLQQQQRSQQPRHGTHPDGQGGERQAPGQDHSEVVAGGNALPDNLAPGDHVIKLVDGCNLRQFAVLCYKHQFCA